MRTLHQRFRTICSIWLILALMAPSLSFAAYPSTASNQSLSLEEVVEAATHQQNDHITEAKVFVSRINQINPWVFGTSALIPSDSESHPKIVLFFAEYKRNSWVVYLEHSQNFEQALNLIPSELLTPEQRATLESSSSIAPQGNGSMQLSLPWTTGESQYITGGPHGGKRGAIDFSGGTGIVRSAREGTAYTSCGTGSDYVRVDHGGGISTNYYHLSSISISNGQAVGRGAALGRQSTSASCLGGSATGNHVHFWINQNGTEIAINGIDIGGWTVIAGAAEYQGCMRRVRDNHQICAKGLIPNEGMIGSGVNQRPNTPTLLAPANNTYFISNSVTLSWQDAGDPDNGPRNSRDYLLEVLNNSGSVIYSSGWTFDTSRTVTVSYGTYTWRVKAGDGVTDSPWTSARSFTINRPANPPTLISPSNGATVNGSSVTLSWQDAGDPDNGPRNSRDYILQVKNSSGGIEYSTGWIFETSRTITLPAGSYTWQVRAGDGLGDSTWSSRSFSVVTAPNMPANLRQTDRSELHLTIFWDDMSSDEQGFRLYKWLPINNEQWDFVEYTNLGANSTSFLDPNLNCGTSYYYQISSYNSYGESLRTDWIEATTAACSYPAPPGDPYLINTSPSSVTIGWEDRSSNEDGFNIYRWDWDWFNNTWDFFYYDWVGSNVTSYTDIGLYCGTEYFYLLRSYNAYGESATTGWVRGTTEACPIDQATQTAQANTAIPVTASVAATQGIPPTSTIRPSATATATATATLTASATEAPTQTTVIVTVTHQPTKTSTNLPEPKHYQVFQPHVYKAQAEWTLHRTEDGQHPDENEQQLVWLMNRARSDPAQEGAWLAANYQGSGINTLLLQQEFQSYEAKPPAAFDQRLYLAARAHSEDLIRRDAQDHDNQFERVSAAGFMCWGGAGNVFAYASSALQGHEAFNIDWGGDDGSGMQTGRGHRMAIMSVNANYTNAGFAMLPENNRNTQVGPFVTTQNFCYAKEDEANHFNRFIVGTVWRDLNNNQQYDPGEGLSGIEVHPSRGSYFAITSKGGGYAIPVEYTGEVTVRFSLSTPHFKTVTIGADSVLVDLPLPFTSGFIVSNKPIATPSISVDFKEVTGTIFP